MAYLPPSMEQDPIAKYKRMFGMGAAQAPQMPVYHGGPAPIAAPTMPQMQWAPEAAPQQQDSSGGIIEIVKGLLSKKGDGAEAGAHEAAHGESVGDMAAAAHGVGQAAAAGEAAEAVGGGFA